MFNLLTLIQLKKLNSKHPVPLILVNYHGFFDGLLALLQAFDKAHVLKQSEVEGIKLAKDNEEVLRHLADFYDLPLVKPAAGEGPAGVQPAAAAAAATAAAGQGPHL